MRVLQGLFEKERKKHNLGICIPEASKRKAMEERLQRKKMVRGEIGSSPNVARGGSFQVTGIFHVHESLMLQGVVLEGSINKKDVTSFQGVKLRVTDIQAGRKSSISLQEDGQGAIFLKAEKGKFPIIRSGDVLLF